MKFNLKISGIVLFSFIAIFMFFLGNKEAKDLTSFSENSAPSIKAANLVNWFMDNRLHYQLYSLDQGLEFNDMVMAKAVILDQKEILIKWNKLFSPKLMNIIISNDIGLMNRVVNFLRSKKLQAFALNGGLPAWEEIINPSEDASMEAKVLSKHLNREVILDSIPVAPAPRKVKKIVRPVIEDEDLDGGC